MTTTIQSTTSWMTWTNRTWRTTGRTGRSRSPVGARRARWPGCFFFSASVFTLLSSVSEKEVNELLDELFDTVSFQSGCLV